MEDGKTQQDQQPSNTLSRAATVINNISHSILFKMTLSKVLSRQNEIITAARLGSVIAGVYIFCLFHLFRHDKLPSTYRTLAVVRGLGLAILTIIRLEKQEEEEENDY